MAGWLVHEGVVVERPIGVVAAKSQLTHVGEVNLLIVRQMAGVGSLGLQGLFGCGALGQQGHCEQGKRGVGGFHGE